MKTLASLLLVALATSAQAAALSAAPAPKPNIVVILCDDLGYADVGFNGSKDIRTPEIDKLAQGGTIFSSAYVTHSFCGPSRASIMTGRYPHEIGAPFNLPNSGDGIERYNACGVDLHETFISEVLHGAGYFTGALGKWHLGTPKPYQPNSRGFDDFYGFLGGGHDYFPARFGPMYARQVQAGQKNINDYIKPLVHNGKEVAETEYLTDGLTREAIRFVNEAATKKAPFFLYLAYNAPHVPLEAKAEDLAQFPEIKDKNRKNYAAMVYGVDRGVGKFVEALKATGAFDNTLIIFMSDNGGNTAHGANNAPLHGRKGDIWEGGYRVPMLFHWPKEVPAGKRFDYPVTALDFYPTFARLAGATIPEGKKLDGLDIWSDFMAGQNPREHGMIFAVRYRGAFSEVGARRDQWKITRTAKTPWKLFNLNEDIGEVHDLSAQFPQVVSEMVSSTEIWSRGHIRPWWFDDEAAEANWDKNKMPNYDATFKIVPAQSFIPPQDEPSDDN